MNDFLNPFLECTVGFFFDQTTNGSIRWQHPSDSNGINLRMDFSFFLILHKIGIAPVVNIGATVGGYFCVCGPIWFNRKGREGKKHADYQWE
ncbi:hypothetical protein D3C87_1709910 [compost metagenome]